MCHMCDANNNEQNEHPAGCACGKVTCPNLTLEQLKKAAEDLTVRVLSDEDDVYIHNEDIGTALVASARLQEMANAQIGAPPDVLGAMQALHSTLISNTYALLADTGRHVNLTAQEVPETIPDDWGKSE